MEQIDHPGQLRASTRARRCTPPRGSPTVPRGFASVATTATLALGAVLRPTGGIPTTGQITPGRTSYLGVVLSGDHPFSFSYLDSIANPLAGLSPALPPDLLF